MQRLVFSEIDDNRRDYHIALTRLRESEGTFTHTHDFPEVFLVTAGKGTHCCNRRNTALAPGDLVWVAPDDTHHYLGAADARLVFINVAVSPAWWQRFSALLAPGEDLLRQLRGAPPSRA